jgi:hypothetical protein
MRGGLVVLLALVGAAVADGAAAQDFALQRGLVGGGIGIASGAQHTLVATVGQPVIGLTTGPAVQLCSGFWCRAAMAPTGVPVSLLPAPFAPALQLSSSPNPFNPATAISFIVASSGSVELVVHDVAGRLVRRLWRGAMPAGRQVIAWDGSDDAGHHVGSGVFIARLTIGLVSESRRLTLLK